MTICHKATMESYMSLSVVSRRFNNVVGLFTGVGLFNIFLADRDMLQNEPNIESMRYCNRKLLNVFEDSAQRVRTIDKHSTE